MLSNMPRAGRAARVIALLATLCALAGCAAGGAANGSFAQANDGTTIAFESVDGPPPQVFDRLVNILNSESELRNLAIVSRGAPASYRVRSYLAAQTRGGRTAIAWVWDVYDRDQQRALRLSGEEPAANAGRDAWSGADDLVLRKIAQAGFSGLNEFINGGGSPAAPSAPPAPETSGPAVASADPISGASGTEVASALGFSGR